MSLLDELNDRLSRPALKYAGTGNGRKEVWQPICVCGHIEGYHAPEIGGSFLDKVNGAFKVEGCRGAIPNRGVEPKRIALGDYLYTATCPCQKMRPVADVDRSGRTFRQKVYTQDFVHPFMRGMKALHTWVHGMKGIKDPDAEFERRLVMREAAQVCAVCGFKGATVLPAFSTKQRDSEMRCKDHYEHPIG